MVVSIGSLASLAIISLALLGGLWFIDRRCRRLQQIIQRMLQERQELEETLLVMRRQRRNEQQRERRARKKDLKPPPSQNSTKAPSTSRWDLLGEEDDPE